MKQLIRIGDREFYGISKQYKIPDELAKLIVETSSVEELEKLKNSQIENENYEGAGYLQDVIDKRRHSTTE